jgi:predicted DNA-binding transcriptional regulator AlpA
MSNEPNGTARAVTMSASEAAEYLSISESTLKRFCKNGNGPKHARLSRVLTFRQADLDVWLNEQFDKPAKSAPKKLAKTKKVADPLAA